MFVCVPMWHKDVGFWQLLYLRAALSFGSLSYTNLIHNITMKVYFTRDATEYILRDHSIFIATNYGLNAALLNVIFNIYVFVC